MRQSDPVRLRTGIVPGSHVRLSTPQPIAYGRPGDPGSDPLVAERLAALEQDLEQRRAELEAVYLARTRELEERTRTMREEAVATGERAGYAAGYAVGERDGQARYAEQVARLADLVVNTRHDFEGIARNFETATVDLALEIAETILQRQVKEDPSWLSTRVQGVLSNRAQKSKLRLLVAPATYDALAPEWDSALAELVGDSTVEVGGGILMTEDWVIDLQPTSMLDDVRAAFARIAHTRAAEGIGS